VLSGNFQRESFDIRAADDNMGRVAVQSWMPEVAARNYFAQMGQDFDALKQAALQRDFRPVELGGQVSFDIEQQVREIQSRNVVAKLEGASRADEYIVYTAHWDHLGMDRRCRTPSSTARWTMHRARRRCWRSPRPS
jgi:Zn-dependent M28 family amino/carboxypeptidase